MAREEMIRPRRLLSFVSTTGNPNLEVLNRKVLSTDPGQVGDGCVGGGVGSGVGARVFLCCASLPAGALQSKQLIGHGMNGRLWRR